ncbi:shufflon system plasmid conjugative transfer pilus tip adhesin PilV [Acetobacter pasteurianus]|uniref:shufflon system plasmid conjugative transfer pilus tip adhesin PilV n=1 Tax=Acetobacter pasteurianus TaxID=438 RepID=UPI00136293DA|nr:shufflon system plasmid conjugative transfer pilus tip adhesin PilV [Acetobacter pasteurianus]QHM90092.1 shufflon system plasmid conjugative transfer pilus tip adhesin PilV [Acetobacter pasteurianus]
MRDERGYTPLQVSGAILVMALMTPVLADMANIQVRKMKDASAADQMQEVYVAAQNWVKDNASQLETLVGDAGGVYQLPAGRQSENETAPAESLQGQGYMPDGFVDTNSYNQHSVMTIWPDANNPSGYDMMVYTVGGNTIRDGDISRIGQKLSAAGGGYFNSATPNRPSGTVSGVDGGWSYPVDNLGGDYGTPQPGHIAASGQFTINGGLADFLYRNDIGIHEANTMHTNIDMTGNRLDSTGEINGRNPSTGTNSNVAVGSKLIGHNWTDPSDTKVYVANSLGVCAQQPDLEGCGVTVSPGAGGFYKNGDWLAFNGTVSGAGLHVTGPGNNFQVDGGSRLVGEITAETGLDLINGGPITWSKTAPGLVVLGDTAVRNSILNSQLHIMGAPLAVDAMSYLDGNATTRYVFDTDDTNYYLHPSGRSQLASAQFSGHIGTNGLDPDSGYPASWADKGLHTRDVYSEGTIAAGINGNIAASLSGTSGNLYASGTSQLNQTVNIGTVNGSNPRANLALENGDVWVNDGNIVVNQYDNDGTYEGGGGWFQSGVTIGKSPSNNYGHFSATSRGADLSVFGNQYLTGALVFSYGVDNPDLFDGESNTATGGHVGVGDCTVETTGVGSLVTDSDHTGLYFCSADHRYHKLQTVDGYAGQNGWPGN